MWRSLLAGLMLLLPTALVVIVVAKVFQLGREIAAPILAQLPLHNPNAWVFVDGTAAVLLLGVCLLLGKIAQNRTVRDRFGTLDNILVDFFPRYTVLKSFVHEGPRGSGQLKLPQPVACDVEGVVQIGLEIERNDNHVVVYIPEAPSAWAGTYIIVPTKHVQALDVSAKDVAKFSRNLGRGSLKALPHHLPAQDR